MKQKLNDKTNYLKNTENFFKTHVSSLIVFVLWFMAVLVIAFFDVATSDTVLSFSLKDYEVGMISDKTVIAEKTLYSDSIYPFEIKKDEVIIKKGFPITEEAFGKLEKLAETPEYIDTRAFANAILYFMLVSALIFFLFTKGFLNKSLRLSELIFYSLDFILVYGLCTIGKRFPAFGTDFSLVIIIPATFVVILVTILYGQKEAVYFSFIIFFAIFYATDFSPIPAIFELCSCLSAVRVVRKMDRRFDMVVAAIVIAVLNAVFLVTLMILTNSQVEGFVFDVICVAFNGFISCILALGFLTPLESILNTASVFRLMDLSDLNIPIMRRLLLNASGTYNHSMMVASLAESACSEIGANPLLARVGAYYHDLGKIDQPEYFVENQTGTNKHDDINPSLSVSVIRSHVKKGIEKAHQLHLPSEVIDIIAQHHGNSVISYFYNEAKKQNDTVSESEFSYSGEPPTSKEAAVVMLADTVEAACRTLDKPSVSRLEKFIHQLVMAKFEHGQLENCDLTFKDLNIIESSFVTILAGHYHSRIEYPDQKDPDEKTLSEKSVENQVEKTNKTLSEKTLVKTEKKEDK